MTPNVMLKRCDIEVASQDGFLFYICRPCDHAIKKIELLAKFYIFIAIRDVAADRDVNIIELNTIFQFDRYMACLAIGLPVVDRSIVNWDAANCCNAVIGRLPVDDDMPISQLPKYAFRENIIGDLGFLQTQDVGLLFAQKSFDNVDPGTDGIDIPGGDAKLLRHARLLRGRAGCRQVHCAKKPSRNNRDCNASLEKQSPHPGGIWDEGQALRSSRIIRSQRFVMGNRGKPHKLPTSDVLQITSANLSSRLTDGAPMASGRRWQSVRRDYRDETLICALWVLDPSSETANFRSVC